MIQGGVILKSAAPHEVFPLHSAVFGEELTDAILRKRELKGELSAFMIISFGETVGYTILQYRDGDCHIWLLGLLPKFRGRGLGGQVLQLIERQALSDSFKRITMSTFNHRPAMLALAVQNGYRIIGIEEGSYGDKVKIRMVKALRQKRELRIVLTNRCNFRCIFCHSEGIDADKSYESVGAAEVIGMIAEAVRHGYDDITFTGGEPLLKAGPLIDIIRGISGFEPAPDVTVVSNASPLTGDLIPPLREYPGKLKLNISLHSLDRRLFDEITRTDGNYDTVTKNIRNATQAGIRVKLNCVMLAGINAGQEALTEYIKRAADLNVSGVKFLELLVLPHNHDQYSYFVSSDSIAFALDSLGAERVSESQRVSNFSHPDFPNLGIEVTKTTCKVGCAQCLQVRDRTLGPDLNYYPCFIHSDRPVRIEAPGELIRAFKQGDRSIAAYAEQYGDDSPILIKQDKFIKSRTHAFFSIGLEPKRIEETIRRYGFKMAKKLKFRLVFCRPENADTDWLGGKKSLKFGYDEHSPHSVKFIFSRHLSQERHGVVCWHQQFLSDLPPPACNSMDRARGIMDALSFSCYMECSFDIVEYRKRAHSISIDRTPGTETLKVSSCSLQDKEMQSLLAELKAENIRIPHHLWLEHRQVKLEGSRI